MATFLRQKLWSEFRSAHLVVARLSSTRAQFKMASTATKVLPPLAKSPLDMREYRALQLPNKLTAILINDPKTDKSAAAMSVAAGSMNDPQSIPGLAHFCEHMLFLGTSKYPAENDYNKFLSDNGGSSNAYTARDHTNYYFDIGPESLDPALDKFSQFFISPLFTESATEREVNAVNSEHDKNLSSDLWRINQLQCSLAKSEHPYSFFATGNRYTLWDAPNKENVNVRGALMDYHLKYYSANIMNLTVLGTESLDELQSMVESKFGCIENRDANIPRWDENPFGPEELQARVNIVPVKDIRHLTLQFPIPDPSPFYKSGSEQYVSHLIGHEGPGSLLSLLKKMNWVNTLSAGGQVPARGFAVFKISVDLTPQGLAHTEDIMTMIFQYIKLLQTTGAEKWIWDELKDLNALQFRYKDKENPQNFVSHVSSSLHDFPPEDVLTAGFLLSEYKPDLITNILDHLTPQKCLVLSSSKSYETEADLSEKWYGVKYSRQRIDESQVEKWTSCCIHPDLKLPKPNAFIPTRFDLKPREDKGIIPEIVSETGISRIWFLQDNEFLLPKAMARVEFYSALPLIDPKNTNLNQMFSMIMKDLLTEESYAASTAGLGYDITSTIYGFEVLVNGYDDKMHVLMLKIVETMANFACSQARFDVLKEGYARSLKNFADEQPYTQAMYYMGYLLREKRWLHHELVAALESVTLKSLNRYAKDFLEKLKLEWLIYGNLTRSEAEDLVKNSENYLKNKGTQALSPSQVTRMREFKLPSGSNYLYKLPHLTHPSSCTATLFQAGMLPMKDSLVLELLCHIVHEPCFNQLRTQEQLGYIVFSGVRRTSGTEGLQILVQSDRHPGYVDSRIEDFLCKLEELLTKMTEEEFQQHRAGLTVVKKQIPKKIQDRGLLLWSEINTQQYIFDRQSKELEELEKVTLQDVVKCFSSLAAQFAQERKRMSVHVHSVVESTNKTSDEDKEIAEAIEKKATIVDDVPSWKQTMELYPCVHPWAGKAKL